VPVRLFSAVKVRTVPGGGGGIICTSGSKPKQITLCAYNLGNPTAGMVGIFTCSFSVSTLLEVLHRILVHSGSCWLKLERNWKMHSPDAVILHLHVVHMFIFMWFFKLNIFTYYTYILLSLCSDMVYFSGVPALWVSVVRGKIVWIIDSAVFNFDNLTKQNQVLYKHK
jgi:hypothetical protein